MKIKSYRSLVWDIETGSVADLHTYGPGFVRLAGYQGDDDEPVVTTNIEELIQAILLSERHYGFNSLGFDCVALATWYDVDYRDLTENHVDLMLVERQVNPPHARGGYPRGYWGLDQTVARYGGDGKTDNLAKLAAKFGGFDKIPVDNKEYVSYTYGDIAATRFLADKIGGHYETDPYLPREHELMRRIHFGLTMNGLRVDRELNEKRLEEQRTKREESFRKLDTKFDIPLRTREVTVFENPFRVDEGKEWFEKKCEDLGIGHRVPRTKTGAVSMTEKGIGKMLETAEDPDEIDFLCCVIAAMDTSDKEAVLYLHQRFGLPLERVVEYENKKPLATTVGKKRLEELFREYRVYSHAKKTGKTNQLSTSKDDLEWLVSECHALLDRKPNPELKRLFSEFEELANVIIDVTTERSVYGTIRDYTRGNGRAYPEIDARQASGRWSMTKPGLTVMGKKGGKWREREVILADDDDSVVVCFDADQVDQRAIAGHCQDPAYMELFAPGRDFHSEVAEAVFGRSDGDWREKAKILGHGTAYGLGPKGAANQANVDLSVAYEFQEGFRRRFPILEEWKTRVRTLAEMGELLDNGFGRMMKPDRQRGYTQGPALKGQGGTRDLLATWILRLDWKVVKHLRGIIHDELVFSFSKEDAEWMSKHVLDAGTFEWQGVPITCGATEPAASWGGCYAK